MNWKATRKVIGWTIWGGVTAHVVFDLFFDAVSKFGWGYGIAVGIGVLVFYVLAIALLLYLIHE